MNVSLFQYVSAAFVVSAASVCLYHLMLMGVALGRRRRIRPTLSTASHSFAIVIPAHDEEHTIAATLSSCGALDYPGAKYRVYVIADNCSDRTAQVASASGAVCLRRYDEENRGKGHALRWAFQHVLREAHDAIVVLDADCQIDPHALRVFDEHLATGQKVLQANYVVANVDANGISYLLAVANRLENDYFYAPKSILGLSVFLRGTGMVFHRDVLERFRWNAESIVEDIEYTLTLIRESIPIAFIPEARVVSDFPTEDGELAVQRTRWISGHDKVGRRRGLRMIWQGLAQWQLLKFDAGMTTWIVSRPLIVLHLITTVGLAMLCVAQSPNSISIALAICAAAIVLAYSLYAAVGVLSLGMSWRRLLLAASLPIHAAKYVCLAIRVMCSPRPTSWNRTPRPTCSPEWKMRAGVKSE